MDERTPFEKYKARRQLLHNCEYQMALLESQRQRLEQECREMKANLPPNVEAIIDRVILENADVLNKLSKV